MKPTVLLDCDGILADFTKATLELIRKMTGRRYEQRDITTWEIFDSLPEMDDLARDEIYRILKAPGGCTSIPIYPDAQDGVRRLRELATIVIVTSPFSGSPTWMHERELWLKEHFGDGIHSVIHAKHKHHVHGDFFIDDKPSHIKEWLDYWVRSGRDPNAVGMVWRTPRAHHDEVDSLAVQVEDWDSALRTITSRLLRDAAPMPPARACPCLHTTPCQPDCTCVTPVMSAGCLRCCSYGSPDQRQAMAKHLASAIDKSWPGRPLMGVLSIACEQCQITVSGKGLGPDEVIKLRRKHQGHKGVVVEMADGIRIENLWPNKDNSV